MKEFKDLDFKLTPRGDGIQAIMKFDNEFGVSVVKSKYSYGGDKGLYEMAILNINGEITYDTEITEDVLGYLEPDDVTKYMIDVQRIQNINLFKK